MKKHCSECQNIHCGNKGGHGILNCNHFTRTSPIYQQHMDNMREENLRRSLIIEKICNTKQKEKKMYEPTAKCSFLNISEKVYKSGCNEACAEMFRACYNIGVFSSKNVLSIESEAFTEITKTSKRRNYLSDNGFIKEKIELKPCPFCGSTIIEKRNNGRIKCYGCQGGAKSIKAWNKRQ